MGRTTQLRREIKRTFIPYLREKGFSSDKRHAPGFFTFRKITSDAVYVCDIQWDKNGRRRFVVNFGKCGAEGGSTFHGRRVLPEDVFPFHTPEWGRLAPGGQQSTRGWFRQDRPLLKRVVSFSKLYTPDEVVSKLMTLFVEVEDYWNSGGVGPHLSLTPALQYYAPVQRLSSRWDPLLSLVYLAAWVGVWYALFRLVWTFHIAIYLDHQLGQFWQSRSALSLLMGLSILPGAIMVGSMLASMFVWLISPAQRTSDSDKPAYPGTSFRAWMRGSFAIVASVLAPSLVLAMTAAYFLKSLQ